MVTLDELFLNLSDKKIIYITDTAGQPTSYNTARLLATQSSISGKKVAICDTTGQSEKDIKTETTDQNADLPFFKVNNKFSVLKRVKSGSFFTSPGFSSTIKDLTNNFDQVFVCSSKNNVRLGLVALVQFNPSLVVISGLRKTKKLDIKSIRSQQSVDILLYD